MLVSGAERIEGASVGFVLIAISVPNCRFETLRFRERQLMLTGKAERADPLEHLVEVALGTRGRRAKRSQDHDDKRKFVPPHGSASQAELLTILPLWVSALFLRASFAESMSRSRPGQAQINGKSVNGGAWQLDLTDLAAREKVVKTAVECRAVAKPPRST
jgi:hypothetical protein